MATTTKENQSAASAGSAAIHKGVEAAKSATSAMADKARDTASMAADKARDAASTAADKAESAAHRVGAGMESLGGAVREHAPRTGMLHNAGEAIAESLEGGGRFLEEEGLRGVGDSLTHLIRNNPVPALLLGIGFGFALARILRS